MKKRNNYYNCFMMSLMSVLEISEIKTDYLINNLNIELLLETNKRVKLNTDELLFLRTIDNDYNISIDRKKYECIDATTELLRQRKRIVAMVDIFYLPYCIYYKKHHEKHSVVVEYIDEGNVIEIKDYYYGYFGELGADCLLEILEKSNQSIENGISIFSLVDINDVSYDIDASKIIDRNKKLYYKESENNCHYGYNAIKILYTHLKEFKVESDKDNDYIEYLYTSIKDIAMYRDGYSRFLKEFGYNDLSDLSSKCAKEWLLLGNLLLMASVKNKYKELQHRILKRFDMVIDYEAKIMNFK